MSLQRVRLPPAAALIVPLVSTLLSGGASAAAGPGAPVPVEIATASPRTVEIELSGLGTVQAWQSVTARAQVNGYLSGIDFREGQLVKVGDVLATIDPRPYAAVLAQAVARRVSDDAALRNDTLNLKRDTSLAASGYQTQQQADNDLALVREYTANVQADDAAIEAARLNLEFCTIRAPIDGVVGFRLLDLGNLIQASAETAIVTVQKIQPIAVVFTLPQEDFGKVETLSQGTALRVLAYSPDDRHLLDTGTVAALNNQISTASGTLSIKAVFPNSARRLWPGQSVQARLELAARPGSLSVPDQAIQHGPDGLYVFLVSDAQTVHQQPVQVGYDDGTVSVVSSGLTAGQRIVTEGQSRLQEGSRVQPQAAAGSRS